MKNTVKRNIILSALLIIMLCVSLISGATYALFTSESEVNIAITSGKVKVEATIDNLETYSIGGRQEVGKFETGGTATFNDGTMILDKLVPGDKAKFNITVKNNSNVKVAYRIRMIAEGTLANALEAIATIDNNEIKLTSVENVSAWKEFDSTNEVVIPVSIELPITVGNEYQNKTANATIVIEAIQGNAAATFVVNGISYQTWDEAFAAARENGTILISGTVEIPGIEGTSQVTDLKNVTIQGLDYATLVFVNYPGSTVTGTGTFSNMNLKDLTVVDETYYTAENGENAWEFTYLEIGGTNTFKNVIFSDSVMVEAGQSTFNNCTFIGHNNDSSSYGDVTMYGAWVYGGKAYFNSCIFTGTRGLKTHNAYGSDIEEVIVDECVFENLSEKPGVVIGTIDDNELTIKNCTFKNTQAGDAKANPLKGIPYVYETDSKHPVLENNQYPVEAANNNQLNTVIAFGETMIQLGDGEYIIPDIPESAKDKTLTIIGNGNSSIAVQNDGGNEQCDYSFDGANVVFENITITTDSHTYAGYARLKATYNNCTFNGTYTLYDESVFNNCTFNISGDAYNIWTWGSESVEFNNCTFNCDGKAVLLYGGVATNLVVNNCVFNDNDPADAEKAAIETGDDYNQSYTLTVTNITVNGFSSNANATKPNNIPTNTNIWSNKDGMDANHLTVIIDGQRVY